MVMRHSTHARTHTTHARAHTHTNTRAPTRAHTRARARTHTHTHAHTHTHTDRSLQFVTVHNLKQYNGVTTSKRVTTRTYYGVTYEFVFTEDLITYGQI
jgi:hypothetical protein